MVVTPSLLYSRAGFTTMLLYNEGVCYTVELGPQRTPRSSSSSLARRPSWGPSRLKTHEQNSVGRASLAGAGAPRGRGRDPRCAASSAGRDLDRRLRARRHHPRRRRRDHPRRGHSAPPAEHRGGAPVLLLPGGEGSHARGAARTAARTAPPGRAEAGALATTVAVRGVVETRSDGLPSRTAIWIWGIGLSIALPL